MYKRKFKQSQFDINEINIARWVMNDVQIGSRRQDPGLAGDAITLGNLKKNYFSTTSLPVSIRPM